MRGYQINFVLILGLIFFTLEAQASNIKEVPFNFITLEQNHLDWYDSADDNESDKMALPFSVTLEGRTYTHFSMSSDGYIQLLEEYAEPSYYGYGSISDLIYDDLENNYELENSYILISYDDLSSEYFGYYGYKKYSDKIIFYYDTETYEDSGEELLNTFEVILYQSGSIIWNFKEANYQDWDYGLYTGLYLTDPDRYFVQILPAITNEIPEKTSYLYGHPVPIPPAILLMGTGLTSLFFFKKRRTS